ncbi:hypothetical protein AXG93_3911s1740 [Marchantia polymorpha subsp. ruderalis]|uniref:Rab3-GAP regulatory subunit N-terminal domain-containing protein n=3 Tax=Marchantia polymorpha TaxID=3197 RepID=A0A176W4F2_MARPO|nr:hypothetical protein AXG93_3911s1740 [Marchantia polymorpha subsp. ruderalis]
MATVKGVQYCGWVIADNEPLEDVGAGFVGWLDSPDLVIAMTWSQMAIAKKYTLVMQLKWKRHGDFTPVTIRVGNPDVFEENVTSMEWLVFSDFTVLAVGTSAGALRIYTEQGTLLFQQQFNSGPLLRLRARQDGNIVVGLTASEDVCLVFPKAIARIDVVDLHTVLRKCQARYDRVNRRSGELHRSESFSLRLPYEMWNVGKSTASSYIADGALACVMAPPLLEHQLKRHYCALTVGEDCTLAAFRVSGEKRDSFAGIVFDKVMPAAISTFSHLTKRFWKTDPTSEANRPTEVASQAFGRATLITTLRDKQRKGLSLALSSSGSLAAVTDSLGRISLIDVQALVVVRLWKGYREAHCVFLEAPVDGRAEYEIVQSRRRRRFVRDEFKLCLAIHAPRRGVVEVWQMRYGARLMIVKCTEGCRLLQPTCKFSFSNELTLESVDEDEYIPAQVYMFQGNAGVLQLLNPFARSTW